MANPVDHEAFEAAQALCMLALDARQLEIIDGDETEDDDCVITHARPVVHRYHPYRRPEPQQAPRTVAIAKRDVVALHRSMNEWAKTIRGNRDDWNVFPLEEHEMHPAPVPEVHRVIRNGAAVMEKVPLSYAQPSAVHEQVSPPIQQPITSHRDNTSVRPTPIQRPSPLRQVHSAPPPTPADEGPRTIQQPTTGGQTSPAQLPSHAAGSDQYSFRALTLQALLAAPEGEFWSRLKVADWLEEQYPQLRDQEDKPTFMLYVGNALTRNVHTGMLEKCPAVKGEKYNQYRLLSQARETATIIAWKTKQPPGPKFASQGKSSVKTPYSWKSLALQGLLAAPGEGQWIHAREVINYLATQYPHFLGYRRDSLVASMNMALRQCHALVEKSMQFGRAGQVFWRLAPGVRDEATRLAWLTIATHREPE